MKITKSCLLCLVCALPLLCQAQFVKVTDNPIVDLDVSSTGAAWGDYNNDGYEDLFINVNSSLDNRPSVNYLFKNNGDGSFSSITDAGLSEDSQGRGATWGDYDNDGNLDLFLANGGPNYLYYNNGDGTFLKIENEPIVDTETFYDSNSCAWGDYNHDGYLDLYISNYNTQDVLFLNTKGIALRSNSTSGPVAFLKDEHNLPRSSESISGSWVDFDNNGTLDLMVSNYYEFNELFSNDGLGGLSYATNTGLQITDNESVGTSWADFDNDGDLDLFLNNNVNRPDEFYRNNGDGTFTEVQNLITISDIRASSSAWGDFDNDGRIDLAIVTDEENHIFRNTNGGFENVTEDIGFSDNTYSNSVTTVDYNNDGFLDLFVANDRVDFLYKNQPNANHWIQVKLVGTKTNHTAIGANVRIKTADGWQMRTTQSQSAHNAQNSMIASFGLKSQSTLDTLRVEWPLNGVQELYHVDADQRLVIEEMEFPGIPDNLSANIDASGTVELIWSDNSDNESGFIIERAVKGRMSYSIIASVEANTTFYTDTQMTGSSSYRVSAKTTNGSSWFSNIVSVDMVTMAKARRPFHFYPNPAHNHLVLENIPQHNGEIEIIDAVGKRVKYIKPGEIKSVVSIADLDEGLYVLIVSGKTRHKFYKKG